MQLPTSTTPAPASLQISNRALQALGRKTAWDLMMHNKRYPRYHPEKSPNGLIDLSGAGNELMGDWMANFLTTLPELQVSQTLSYGPLHGSPALRKAAAGFFNSFFKPASTVTADNVLVANGVTSLIDLTAWTMCESGDALLTLTPTFYMLDLDLVLRAGVVTIPVSTEGLWDPAHGEDSVARSRLLQALDAALQTALEHSSLRCRGLFICNPMNPQGRCYSRLMLEALAHWCASKGLYLISDEIYGLSNFAHASATRDSDDKSAHVPPSSFCSVLEIARADEPLAQNIQCFYGLSKDFGMGGLRIGFWVSRNAAMLKAAALATWFTWVNAFADHVATWLLQDSRAVSDYIFEYRRRLSNAYLGVTQALRSNKIPFNPADAGLFVSINLHEWIHHFSEDAGTSPEHQLCHWLTHHGVFLNPGEVSTVLEQFPSQTQ
ncbi:hypothetical protein KAF25_009123 [Fusarium avenaceum]|uniref:Aminotransferase class I/classII large domain-containing protein n=1 Tax=Fusarium avenaceum TaxID=40199 RepID=A0A9P7GT94_9HYPO|nr:hypothetical protein KAF25_009123 [Fusarium avenaceum]